MEKIMLITGCSHAAGHEIDGNEDSKYNRQNSFPNLLAEKLGYRPINTATGGNTNPGIARTVIEWCSKHYNPDTMKLLVLAAWTEPTRMEIPWHRPSWYVTNNKFINWLSSEDTTYIRVNAGHTPTDPEEKYTTQFHQEFIATNDLYLQILSANLVMQTQYYLKMQNIDYVMCNSSFMFSNDYHLDFYKKQIDQTRYLDMSVNDNSFFLYYANQGYKNLKAKYFHHDEIPHNLYSEKLLEFIQNGNLISN